MLEGEHSLITHSSRLPSDSHSDLNSLNNLRELLPGHHPINAIDHYLIEEGTNSDCSWASSGSEEGKDLISKITEQTHEILQLRQQLYYYKTEFYRLAKEITTLKQPIKSDLQVQNHQRQRDREWEGRLTSEIKKRVQLQEGLKLKQAEAERLHAQVQRLSGQLSLRVFERQTRGCQQLRYQQQVIMELAVKNEKVMRINAFLIQQLRAAEVKLIELERDDQQKICGQLFENFYRLKENKNNSNNKPQEHSYREVRSHTTAPFNHTSQQIHHPRHKYTLKRPFSKDSFSVETEKSKNLETYQEPTRGDPEEKGKLQPLQEPKPQRKLPRISEGEASKKFQRATDGHRLKH